MRTKRLVPIAVASLLVLSACGSENNPSDPTGPADLDGRTFLSTDVTVDGEPKALADKTMIRLSFLGETISANAGCNSMSGTATIEDGVLGLDGGLAMTEMGCDQERMDQDQWLSDLLGSKPTVDIAGDELTLTAQAVVISLVDEEVADPDRSLTGTGWKLDTIIDGDVASSVPAGVTSTIRFTGGGEVGVSLGCNSGGGKYTVDSDIITFGPMGTTQIGCTREAADVEGAVLAVLNDPVQYTLDGASLTLSNETQGLIYHAD
jgi:heat shock protein HslJ